VLFRADYEAIARNRGYFGDFDPFGDFDLLFGAAKLNLRIVDLPIRYRARTYGKTNIHRWRHGWLLLKMVCVAARRLKFHPMTVPLAQHQAEIERNLRAWNAKRCCSDLRRILSADSGLIDLAIPGRIVEIGSGIGNLKAHLPGALATDLFPNPWLDLVCDAYELPFHQGSLSHLVLFDVFHHLRAPNAFLRDARRVLSAKGRLVLFEPYISWSSRPVYGLLHTNRWRGRADQPRRITAAAA